MRRTKQKTMRCYLCEREDFTIRDGVVRDDPSLQVYECNNCGLVTLSSSQHILPQHYENSGMHGKDVPSIEAWLHETDQDNQRRFELLKAGLVNRRILDFGCGAGGFLHKARSVAAEVVGIEPERRVHEYWGDTIKIYGDMQDAGDGYDVITAFHVIEHLVDPTASLRKLAGMLDEHGRLVVEIPSSDDALITLYDCDAFKNFTYWSQHLFLFNAETLRILAAKAGMRTISIQQVQRYPLSNHLYWLRFAKPGGHQCWSFLDTPELTQAYAAALAAGGRCDTLIGYFGRGDSQISEDTVQNDSSNG